MLYLVETKNFFISYENIYKCCYKLSSSKKYFSKTFYKNFRTLYLVISKNFYNNIYKFVSSGIQKTFSKILREL